MNPEPYLTLCRGLSFAPLYFNAGLNGSSIYNKLWSKAELNRKILCKLGSGQDSSSWRLVFTKDHGCVSDRVTVTCRNLMYADNTVLIGESIEEV